METTTRKKVLIKEKFCSRALLFETFPYRLLLLLLDYTMRIFVRFFEFTQVVQWRLYRASRWWWRAGRCSERRLVPWFGPWAPGRRWLPRGPSRRQWCWRIGRRDYGHERRRLHWRLNWRWWRSQTLLPPPRRTARCWGSSRWPWRRSRPIRWVPRSDSPRWLNWLKSKTFVRNHEADCIYALSILENTTRLNWYGIVSRCVVTFWIHPEIIPVGQFFRR